MLIRLTCILKICLCDHYDYIYLPVCCAPTQSDRDVIRSKVLPGARKVFRLEAVLEASVEELYDILFVRVEEMHQWNPSIQHIEVSC